MKLVFFVPHFSDGGLERSTIRLAEEIVRRGGEAVLVTLHDQGKMLPQWPDPTNVRVLHRRSTFSAIPALAKLMRSERMDGLVSAQDHANVAAVLAKQLSRKRIPLILTERLSLRAAMKARGWFRRSVLRLLVKYAYPRANAVVANSQDGAREVESVLGWPEGRVAAIYNPTVNDSIEQLAKETVDDTWFTAGNIPVVVGLGRLVEQKDFSMLIHAFANARKTTELRLAIFGDGPQRDDLTNLAQELGISEHVRMEPFVVNPYKYLSRAALFVLSSRYEGLPNALIEAHACGVPTVSTDCPTGPREILDNGELGILVPVGDRELMTEAIVELAANRALANQYVDEATKKLGRFTPQNTYLSYKELIENIRA
jgi:glycosyltransferase involved in cell wall biosynthesis